MPLYDLVCLAKPALERTVLSGMMQRVGTVVMDRGGVLTDIKSYGDQLLAYDIKKPFERYDKVCDCMCTDLCMPTDAYGFVHALLPCHMVLTQSIAPCCVQAHIWQMTFKLNPQGKQHVDHVLRVNKDVLRWVLVKRQDPLSRSSIEAQLAAAEAAAHSNAFLESADVAPSSSPEGALNAPLRGLPCMKSMQHA